MRSVILLLLALNLFGQKKIAEMWPGAQYDPAVPTIQKTLGFEVGERIASHANLMKYFEALAAAQPHRVKLVEYARTWEGRKLVVAFVGNETNIQRLPEIQANIKKLADPRQTNEAEAQRLIANLPALVMLAYGVHGNEISSPDAAMMTAYHLLASKNDKTVDAILANTVILFDPIQNPDGRDRFVHHFEIAEGLEPIANPVAAEHVEPWPNGRTNHYMVDMNRDWFAMTQPETRGRIKTLLDWYPLVFVDLHEMNGDSTYYFTPEAVPYNPHIVKSQREILVTFGRNDAKWFDQFGFRYFTREVYDAFYPGYGASWPIYYGGVAMTYENASARGLLWEKSDGTTFSFAQSVQKHFVAGIATCETAAAQRKTLLENFYQYRKSAIEEGKTEENKEYVLLRQGDTAAADKLADLLAAQGIEVRQAKDTFQVEGTTAPQGSYLISAAQPMKRMIRTFLDPDTKLEEEFLKEQERRRKKKQRDEIYDVTGWSMPIQFNVKQVISKSALHVPGDPVLPGKMPAGKLIGGKASVAYLVPWGTQASGRFLAAAFQANLRVISAGKAFTQSGRKYPNGTLILQVQDNPASVHDMVAKLVLATGAEVVAMNSSWVDDGPNYGSNLNFNLKKPNIAIIWDAPVSGASAGATAYVIERQFGYPVTRIRGRSFATADLSKFQVLIVPESIGSGLPAELGAGLRRIKDWVAGGGVIVGVGSATAFLTNAQVGLLPIQQEMLAKEPGTPAGTGPAAEPGGRRTATGVTATPAVSTPAGDGGPVAGRIFTKEEDYLKSIQNERELPDDVAGVLCKAKVDTESWIGAGAQDHVNALVSGRAIYSPIKIDRGINAAVYTGPGDLLQSGYMWEENRKQLAYKPFVVVSSEGRGLVVAFTADPNYRGYMDGLNILFLNAILRGPGVVR
ncbi:M14 family zinc carboxypeptidase [Bryobacter aggregatus]|uniref:M14 family zinc carboxypeptidase n=1 Tax=Bryobacter aggregatus TaxID=360054 RepID=UPI0004E0D4AE|nr:M14 family zinc carboxypeptidase [Bryobacter aggregatus]